MSEKELLEARKKKFKGLLFGKKPIYPSIVLAVLMIFGYLLRVRNLHLLKDATTGEYIPIALDPFAFLKYAKEVLAEGSLAAVDAMRYYPFGYTQIGEFDLLSHVIVWLYKILHFFNPHVTLEYAHVVYPALFFSLSLVFFYLLVKRFFDVRVALLATAFLTVLPSYLYRTMAGFSDKESLAMFFMFAAIYFYVRALQEKKLKPALISAGIGGIASGLMGLTWGGVSILFIVFGGYILVEALLNRMDERRLYVYTAWLVPLLAILMIFFGERYTIGVLMLSVTSGIMFLAFLVSLVSVLINKYNPLKIKERFTKHIPPGIVSLILSIIIGVLVVSLIQGPAALFTKINSFITNLLEPFGFTRWNLTVAESHQPYVMDWIGQWGWIYMLLLLFGSICLVYTLLKDSKIKWKGTVLYALFIWAFMFSRYKADSPLLNGVSSFSKTLYVGSLVVFGLAAGLTYWYAYKKDKDLLHTFQNFDTTKLFLIIWFVVSTIAARGAIRLLHIHSPITTILVAYAFFVIFDWARKLEKDHWRYIVWGVLLLILVLPTVIPASNVTPHVPGTWYHMYKNAAGQSAATGPGFNNQWQHAMDWTRKETPEDAVFAHWWDYGWWVQGGGNRATLTDGGNAGGYALNYFMGRHVLTGQSELEALEYLYARNATHLLMISDEIGKYAAYSSIGSDVDYDRYSWITTYQMDPSQSQERRNDTLLAYIGGHALSEDFVYGNQVFPARSSGIGGFLVPIVPDGNQSFTLKQPTALMVYNGRQHAVPLECVFTNGREIIFEEPGLPGCLQLIPRVNGQQIEPVGSALYLSPRVRNTLFAHLFLYGQQSDYFKLAYTDEQQYPLMVYNGRLIGPLKIWEMSYPDDLEPSHWYYGNELPDERVRQA